MFDVVCVGNALVDLTVNVPSSFVQGTGLKKGSMTLVDDVSQKFLLSSLSGFSSSLSTGGSSANVALGVSCLGGKSAFIGNVGLDSNGSFFESSLSERGVTSKLFKDSSLSTGSVVVLVTEDGERTFSTNLGAAKTMSKNVLVPESKFLHVEAYLLENPVIKDIIFSLVKEAKKRGIKISFDLSDSSLIQRIKPTLVDFLNEVDVVFANEDEAKAFTGEDSVVAARVLSNICDVAVVKLGDEGSVVVSKNVQEVVSINPVKPVNTNGAGDAYAAGFLYGLCGALSLSGAAKIGSFLAREVVLVEGASLNKSLKDDVLSFFDETTKK